MNSSDTKIVVCTLSLVLLGTLFHAADAVSSGILGGTGYCWNVAHPIGCDPRNFTDPSDHLTCNETTSIMKWAGKPAYTSAFELKGPSGKTSYQPGEWIAIILLVKIYTLRYRGLVISATTADGTMVGEWKSASDVGETPIFWSPSKECMMHAQGDLKPLKMTFRYKAPPAGTGTITFRALIKVGPANDGFFYFPNGNESIVGPNIPTGGFPGSHNAYQLTEGAALTTSWVLGDYSQSCNEACATKSMVCDESTLQGSTIQNPSLMENVLGFLGASVPYIADCGSVSPARTARGWSYYNAVNAGLCSHVTGSNARPWCDSWNPLAARFCSCKSPSARLHNFKPIRAAKPTQFKSILKPSEIVSANAETSEKLPQESNWANNYGPAAVLSLSIGMFSALGFWIIRKKRLEPSMALSILLAFTQPVSAHNWLRSPGRARFEASTNIPFRQRKTTDIHAQLGPGQKMAVKFATGHASEHFFVTLNAADQHYFYKKEYKDYVKDYLANVPKGMNVASKFPRLHACKKKSECQSTTYFDGPISKSDPKYCDHPNFPAANGVYKWKSAHLTGDVLTYYHNEKYPWIVAAARYVNIVHRPGDEDILCMEVPHKNATLGNHHIVHWMWSGYYDAIDVHALPTQVPENLKYGKSTGSTQVTRTDHCQFVKPRKLLTPLRDATLNVSQCLQDLEDVSNNRDGLKYIALNVVQLDNPDLVATSNVVNLPLNFTDDLQGQNIRWPRDTLNIALNSPLMTLSGTVTKGGMDWKPFVNSLTLVKNHKCAIGWELGGLDDVFSAVINDDGFFAIAWYHENRPMTDFYESLDVKLFACRRKSGSGTDTSTPVSSNPFHLYLLPSNLIESEATIGWPADFKGNPYSASYKISFEPATPKYNGKKFNINLQAGWKRDTGAVFSNTRGYGWRCKQRMTIEGAFPKPVPSLATNRSVGRTARIEYPCPDGELNSWEITVPNGAYAATMYNRGNNNGGLGCAMENTRIVIRTSAEANAAKSVAVEVKDGKFTVSQTGHYNTAYHDNRRLLNACSDIHWIKLDYLGKRLARVLNAPTSGTREAWWQTEFASASQPVGAVIIDLPSATFMTFSSVPRTSKGYKMNCVTRWFYEGGNSCMRTRTAAQKGAFKYVDIADDPDVFRKANNRETTTLIRDRLEYQQPWGKFNASRPDVGAVVSLSNSTCTHAGGCPKSDEKICKVITESEYNRDQELNRFDTLIKVDCKGQRGKYLRIYLRGQNRILIMRSVRIHRPVPLPSQLATPPTNHIKYLCYGLEPRTATETGPSFYTTTDPTDPVFYSSCYVKSPYIEWLPLPGNMTSKPEPRKFVFNGECLSCASFKQTDPSIPISQNVTPNWYFSTDTCKNCKNELAPWGEGRTSSSPSLAPTWSPSSLQPTASPSSLQPTSSPSSLQPTASPSSLQPTASPSSLQPTASSALLPTASPALLPTASPAFLPTASPALLPTASPALLPTASPALLPTASPALLPTASPALMPTASPALMPTASPALLPTASPALLPTASPALLPTASPALMPTASPALLPTASPSLQPTSSQTKLGYKVAVVLNMVISQVTPPWTRKFNRKVCSLIGVARGCVKTVFEAGSVKATLKFTEGFSGDPYVNSKQFIKTASTNLSRVEAELGAPIISMDTHPTVITPDGGNGDNGGNGDTGIGRTISSIGGGDDNILFFAGLAIVVCLLVLIGITVYWLRKRNTISPFKGVSVPDMNRIDDLHEMQVGAEKCGSSSANLTGVQNLSSGGANYSADLSGVQNLSSGGANYSADLAGVQNLSSGVKLDSAPLSIDNLLQAQDRTRRPKA